MNPNNFLDSLIESINDSELSSIDRFAIIRSINQVKRRLLYESSNTTKVYNEELEEETTLIDTTNLQIDSLMAFANALGYENSNMMAWFSRIDEKENHDYRCSMPPTIEFGVMIRLHNSKLASDLENNQNRVRLLGDFATIQTIKRLTPSKIVEAQKQKLVTRIKIFRAPRKRKICVNDHRVELTELCKKTRPILFQQLRDFK